MPKKVKTLRRRSTPCHGQLRKAAFHSEKFGIPESKALSGQLGDANSQKGSSRLVRTVTIKEIKHRACRQTVVHSVLVGVTATTEGLRHSVHPHLHAQLWISNACSLTSPPPLPPLVTCFDLAIPCIVCKPLAQSRVSEMEAKVHRCWARGCLGRFEAHKLMGSARLQLRLTCRSRPPAHL